MRRAAIFALLLIAVCTGGLWLSRDESPSAEGPPRSGDSASPPSRHVVVDPTPIEPPPGARTALSLADSGHAAALVEPPIRYGPIEVAESPFASPNSPELRYAVELLFAPDAGADTFRAAGETFERCLQQNPSNARCAAGLVAAQKALHTGSAGVMPVELSVEPIELRAPPSGGPFPTPGKMHKPPGIPGEPR